MKQLVNNLLVGTVTEVAGTSYFVQSDDGILYRASTISGTKSENSEASLVAVGDRVELKEGVSGNAGYEAIISKVLARKTVLARQRDVRRNRSKERVQVIAANIDQLVLIVSAYDPPLNRRLIDRYLVFAESEHLPILLVVNKCDLDDEQEVGTIMEPYHALGYTVLYTSAEEGEGFDELQKALANKLSVFSGHSGVGKSTLINLLTGEERLRTAETNFKTGKGIHTTTNAVMLALPQGGAIIDTPGLREFTLADITRDNLRFYFREFLPFMADCAYSSCTHTVEPDCAIRRAAESGAIDPERYESYLALYDSIEE